LYLAVERFLQQRVGHLRVWRSTGAKIGLALLTYLLVNITWVFFRAQDFSTAARMLRSMLLIDRGGNPVLATYFVVSTVLTIGTMLIIHWYMRNRDLHTVVERVPAMAAGAAWGTALFVIAITQGGSNAFIYFQF
jgi:alginate O-acetyltransferase complex protein AlgI